MSKRKTLQEAEQELRNSSYTPVKCKECQEWVKYVGLTGKCFDCGPRF